MSDDKLHNLLIHSFCNNHLAIVRLLSIERIINHILCDLLFYGAPDSGLFQIVFCHIEKIRFLLFFQGFIA